MKKGLKIAGIVIGALVVVIIGGALILDAVLPAYTPVKIDGINLADTQDGTYVGAYESGLVSVKVAVQVVDHTITQITIDEHENGLGGKAEAITEDIIGAQSVKVDAISGATRSSDVIKKAVEVALQS